MSQASAAATEPITVAELADLDSEALLDRVSDRLLEAAPHGSAELSSTSPLVRAYVAIRLFEGEVLNGGLHQYFINHDDEVFWTEVTDGYRRLGLDEVADTIEREILPVAKDEQPNRATLTSIFRISQSHELSRLPALDHLIDERTEEFELRRLEVVKEHPAEFCI